MAMTTNSSISVNPRRRVVPAAESARSGNTKFKRMTILVVFQDKKLIAESPRPLSPNADKPMCHSQYVNARS